MKKDFKVSRFKTFKLSKEEQKFLGTNRVAARKKTSKRGQNEVDRSST